jgi:hypothetical protein
MRRLGTQLNGPFDKDAFDRAPEEYMLFETEEELLASYDSVNKQAETDALKNLANVNNVLLMNGEDKIQSICNALKILPPNLFIKYQGKLQPKLSDVEAIVGFKVSAAQLKEAMDKNDGVIDES